jgi:hemoglobin
MSHDHRVQAHRSAGRFGYAGAGLAPASIRHAIHQGARHVSNPSKTLYDRLGGYDAIAAVASDLLPRLMADERVGRFWAHRGADGIAREKQLLIDYLCSSAGGPKYYTGRDMKLSHTGMRISADDWSAFLGHLHATLDKFDLPAAEREDLLAFIDSTRAHIVEH